MRKTFTTGFLCFLAGILTAAEARIDLDKFQIGSNPAPESNRVITAGRVPVTVEKIDGKAALVFPKKDDPAKIRFQGVDINLPQLAKSVGIEDFNTVKTFRVSFEMRYINQPNAVKKRHVWAMNLYNMVRTSVSDGGAFFAVIRDTPMSAFGDVSGNAINLAKWTKVDIWVNRETKKAILAINGVIQCNGEMAFFNPDRIGNMIRFNTTVETTDPDYLQFAIRDIAFENAPKFPAADTPKAPFVLGASAASGKSAVTTDLSKMTIPDLKDAKSGTELLNLGKLVQSGSRAPHRSWGAMAAGGKGVFTFSPLPDGSTLCRMSSPNAPSRMQYGIPSLPGIEKYAGQLATFSAMVKGKDLVDGQGPVVVFIFDGMGGDGREFTIAPKLSRPNRVIPTLGTFDWMPITATFRIPDRTKQIRVLCYLMNTQGELEWKNVSLKYTPEVKELTLAMPVSFLSDEEAKAKMIAQGDKHIERRKAALMEQFGKIENGADLYTVNEKAINARPRLLPMGLTLDQIRARAKDPRFAKAVKSIKFQADAFCKFFPPKPNMETEDPLRKLGDSIPWLLTAYIIEDDPAAKENYKKHLYRWVNMLIDWGIPKQDLPLAHAQLGFALVYDWLYDELPADLKAKVRKRLIDSVRYAFSNEWMGFWMWRYGQYLANHNWFVHKIYGLTAVTLWGDNADPIKPGELKKYLDEMIANYYYVEGVHSADGYPVEGVLYQDYGLRPYCDVAAFITPLLNVKYDMLGNPALKKAGLARLSMLLPQNAGFMVYSDANPKQFSNGTFWMLLASYNKDPYTQKVALLCKENEPKEIEIPKILNSQYSAPMSWRELFYFNPDLKAAELSELPLFNNGDELGVYVVRSSWTDPDAAFMGLRCGDAVGSSARKFMGNTLSNGHCYPEQGNFSFYVGTDSIIPGMEYAREKMTANHNLVTFRDSRNPKKFLGQAGEGGAWFDTGEAKVYNLPKGAPAPKVYKKENTKDYSVYYCDLAPYYMLPDAKKKLTKNPTEYKRILVFLPAEHAVVVADRIKLEDATDAKLRLLTGAKTAAADGRDFTLTMKSGNKYVVSDISPSDYERKVAFEKVMSWTNTDRQVIELLGKNFKDGVFAAVIAPENMKSKIKAEATADGISIQKADGKTLKFAW